MEIDGKPDELGEVHDAALRIAREYIPSTSSAGSISRLDFYGRARDCFAVVKTGEKRPYGCFILKKGVVL
jgi:L-fucose mutarotase